MRLKHIHIAGFKSFVDPVTIPATAMLTGVVGPNGCGKSNVIDAVRWVLGESKARELRGQTLQDVIFNGSAQRKPASRASVELLFENHEGRAPGQWSQYAEIAVKRLLTRQGESTYFINNVKVRRRDMADLFLGTGLGGDAYAIIEQGMITRIIESRPEELRGFLEEAAGVSKYKERRKETESRLRDTRENLSRVEDIRQELGRQLEKLSVQAEVARRYFAFDAERTLKLHLLALNRKRDAQMRQSELARQLEATRTELEARTAELRNLEAGLEDKRLAHFDATEALNQAQARFYAESGEVARVEQELKHLHETRQRLDNEIRVTAGRREGSQGELQAIRDEIVQRQADHACAEEQADMLAEQAAVANGELPDAEAAWREAQAAVAQVQADIGRHEQALQLEESNQAHAERVMEQLKARELRLLDEQSGLASLDDAHLMRQEQELEEARDRVAGLEEYLLNAREALPDLEARLLQAQQARDNAVRQVQGIEAELGALRKMQAAAQQSESEGTAWLEREGLVDVPRLWQSIRVEPGWETAVEAALGEAMAALVAEARPGWLAEPPEARFELVLPTEGADADFDLLASDEHFRPLADLIHTRDPLVARFLFDRLALAYAADDLATALARRGALPAGGFIATREGHRVGRASLTFNAPEKGHHGLIARVREMEELEEQAEAARMRLDEISADVAREEEALRAGRRQAEALQTQIGQAQAQIHELQVTLVRAQEAARRVADRRAQIERELDDLYTQLDAEGEVYNAASERHEEARLAWEGAKEQLEGVRAARHEADQRFQAVREAQRRADREAQEAAFQVRSLAARLTELEDRLNRAERLLTELADTQARLEAELQLAQEEPIRQRLLDALKARQTAELELAAARDALEACNAALQGREADRMKVERALDPLRERLQALELKQQESRLLEERFAEELAQVDEAELSAQAEAAGIAGKGEGWLKGELDRLDAAVAGLGAVNMAALDELKATEERKNYLDAQATDLETAANTLEEAIRRIDAETRARLKDTYDQVSREFKRLFSDLFNGGEAQLILTGDEILDAGLTVMAQPPGKKNSSIHLLSGGEKTLTALSLVFAFFQLNPAPFCLLDEVDAPLDDSNTERFCNLVRRMAEKTQFLFITHNRITMELAQHLVGVTMPEPGVSRPVAVDVESALRMAEAA
ncbi:MAG TPA: chromosome segregation protein SMC [Thiobacillaceae bacterium]|nr:chromosome segregation protein SMC [Thiobacillaceae bacterium]